MNLIVKGTFMNAFERSTSKGKKFQVLQVLSNGGKSMALIDIDNFGKTLTLKKGDPLELPVAVRAYNSNGRVGLNIVHFD